MITEGSAGDIHGGDRLPFVATGDSDNFAPLQSIDWQIHVYGAQQPEFLETATALQLPVHVFDWNDAADDAGLMRDAAYLVRPDGYVALAMPAQTAECAEQLRRYAASVFSS